jgi:VWFA-related protein
LIFKPGPPQWRTFSFALDFALFSYPKYLESRGLSNQFRQRPAYAILFTMQTLPSLRALSFVLSVFVSVLPATAQQPAEAATKTDTPAPPTITVKVKEVNLLATVRDKKGQPVGTLEKQDFVLEQDGHAQTITQFARESDLPLTIGVLADTGPGQRKELADERKASTDFVNRLLREGKDKAFVLHFDKQVELLQDVTTSHDKLAKGIDQISVGDTQHSSGTGHKRDDGDSSHPHYFFGGSMLYDAIFLSSDEILKGQSGRKAVVLFSDGVDRESKTPLEHAIQAAQRADAIVYCVYVASEHEEQEQHGMGGRRGGGIGFPGGGGPFPGGGGYPGGGRRGPDSTSHEDKNAGKKILQQISKETGGRYFELSKKLTAAQIYTQVEEDMRHQYSISYTPDKAESGYHKLHLATKNADLSVQTREGFYSE